MKSKKRLAVGAGLGLALLTVMAYAAQTTILGKGTLPYSELINGPAEVTSREFISMPGEEGGWHYHPGPVFNVVTSGTVTVEDGCGGEEAFSAGQAFEVIGGRVHRWKNLGAVPAVEYNTFIVPQGSELAVPLPERRCGPPLNVDECRRDGWNVFTHPHSFMNQGDCMQYVRMNR
jgi:quercetin dioxygenase-like cupin family protein